MIFEVEYGSDAYYDEKDPEAGFPTSGYAFHAYPLRSSISVV
jgi:hypothetical protein